MREHRYQVVRWRRIDALIPQFSEVSQTFHEFSSTRIFTFDNSALLIGGSNVTPPRELTAIFERKIK